MTTQPEAKPAAGDSTRGLFFGDQQDEEIGDADFNRSRAVVIGINEYGNGIPSLSTAVNDARRLAEIL